MDDRFSTLTKAQYDQADRKWDVRIRRQLHNRKLNDQYLQRHVICRCGFCYAKEGSCASCVLHHYKICTTLDGTKYLFDQFIDCFYDKWDDFKTRPAWKRAEKIHARMVKAIKKYGQQQLRKDR